MRVNHPMRDCEIVIKQGENEIVRKKMKKALPAEMIQIPVLAEKLTSSENILVSVVQK